MTTTYAPIAVVGATGQQGGAVVAALLERGAPVRAIARDADRAGELSARGAEVAVAAAPNATPGSRTSTASGAWSST